MRSLAPAVASFLRQPGERRTRQGAAWPRRSVYFSRCRLSASSTECDSRMFFFRWASWASVS